MRSDPEQRGTGRTSRQMVGAPRDAVFVWVCDQLAYPRALAKTLKRTDLMIVGPQWLDRRNLVGREFSGVVLDHATAPNDDQWAAYELALDRVRRVQRRATT